MVNRQLNDSDLDVPDEEEREEIHNFDFERASLLLGIIEKIANVTPKNTSISGIAGAELNMMNEKAKEIARDRAKKAELAQLELDRRRQAEADEANAAQRAEEERLAPNTTRPPRPAPARNIPISPKPNEPVVERRV